LFASMSAIDKILADRGRPRLGLSAALAGLGWLAACCCATAQVSVDTIGGGVRVECGPSYGFTNGNTYDTAQFNAPYSCALDTNGNLWIADKNNNDLEQVSQAGNKAASFTTQYFSTSGTSPHVVTNFHFLTNITGVAVDPANNLYVLLSSPPQVFQCDLTAQSASLNVLSTLILSNAPAGAVASAIAVDGSSNVFLAFTNGAIVRVQLLDSNPPPTVYSEQYALGSSTAVHYIVTNFNWRPSGLALSANGQLAVSDTLSNAIYYVSTNDYTSNNGPQKVTGGNGAGYDDGPPVFAQFNQPHGLAASADGSLIVCDTLNNRVRAIDSTSNTTTLYGTDSNIWPATCCNCQPTLYAGWVDGVAGVAATNAAGRQPVSVAISPNGSLFVTELYYNLIRQVTNTSFSPVNLSATFPAAVTQPASGINSTNGTLGGTVNAGGASTSYYFEWGLTTNYGNFTATNVLTTPQPVSIALSNLEPGTTYHFQLVAFNGFGYSYGGDFTIVTLSEAATVITLPASGVTSSNATLNATIDAEGSPTTAYFQWGTTTNFGNLTTPTNLSTNLTTTQPESWTISNLQAGTIYFFQAVAANSGGMVDGSTLVFSTLSVPAPILSISPSNGYFPNCTNISVTSSVPTVYYTLDGSAPTTNSTEVPDMMTNVTSLGLYVGSIQWCNPLLDLSALRLIAVNGSGTSNMTLLQGSFPATNLIGFPQPLAVGPGGHLYIPVVVELQSNLTLESLQFRVEINPNQAAPTISPFDLQPLTPNDMVPLPGPATGDAPVTFDTFAYTTSSNGQGLVITASGGSSGLDMQGSGVVVMLHLAVPATATLGQSYSLTVVDASGTSDAQQANIAFAPLAVQSLTISDPPYLVGNSSPSTGYNAGQFGDGALDNADVNNAIYASAGIRVPPSDSDIFNAMDAWPPDSTGRGGDGFIRLLDWQTILGRSLGGVAIYPGLDTNNYIRFWTNGDIGFPSHAVVDWAPGGPPVPLSLDSAPAFTASSPGKLGLSNSPPGLVWFCQAAVGAGTVSYALPGSTYSLPVYVNVLPGYNLAALQFRAIVTGSSGAPAVTSIKFSPASGMPSPLVLPGLSASDMVHVWSFGSFAVPLQNSNYLGTVSFEVPPGAGQNASYTLHFSGVDGAPDYSTEYELESHPGSVWVMSSAQQPASITSDEWKLAFFGSLTNSQAGDNVDADGDGALNWQEYLAGTNPTNALSCLKFSSASLDTDGTRGVAINWLTAPGKTYLLQSSAALNGANWTAINTNSGDGNEYQIIVTNFSGNARFYQILLQP
jgi:sugar lactone lactonase YvrE